MQIFSHFFCNKTKIKVKKEEEIAKRLNQSSAAYLQTIVFPTPEAYLSQHAIPDKKDECIRKFLVEFWYKNVFFCCCGKNVSIILHFQRGKVVPLQPNRKIAK